MGKLQDQFDAQFTEYDFVCETEESKVKYLFGKDDMTHGQIDTLAESFNALYNDEVFNDSFDSYLKTLGVDYINMGPVGFEE